MTETEYFNIINQKYMDTLKQPHRAYKLKLELLSYNETAIGEITKDVSITAKGQINNAYNQLVRRSCSLTLIDVDSKYIPNQNNLIWYRRKFRLWLGLAVGNDIYWHSQGVYFTKGAKSDGKNVEITGIDKGGSLDGTLKLNRLNEKYIIKTGGSISDVLKDTLLMNNIGNITPLKASINETTVDPIKPIIETKFDNISIQSEIAVDKGNYIGDIITSLAEEYGADVYYNANGRLVFSTLVDGERIDGYKYMAHQWEYTAEDSFFANADVDYLFDGINTVTVYTNAQNIENVSYTAYNNNPLSPLRVNYVGERKTDDYEITYIDTTQQDMRERCRQYAEYILMKESIMSMSVSFESPIIPHMDVNRTIGIQSETHGLKKDTFVVQSITIPLSSGSMSISAANIQTLPSDMDIEGTG